MTNRNRNCANVCYIVPKIEIEDPREFFGRPRASYDVSSSLSSGAWRKYFLTTVVFLTFVSLFLCFAEFREIKELLGMSSFKEAREMLLSNHDMKIINDRSVAFIAG